MSDLRYRIPRSYRRMPISASLYQGVRGAKRQQLRSRRLLAERNALMRRAIVNSSLAKAEQDLPFKYKHNDRYVDLVSRPLGTKLSALHFRTVVRCQDNMCQAFVLRLHNNAENGNKKEEEQVNKKQEVKDKHKNEKDEEQKAVVCTKQEEGEEEEGGDLEYEKGESEKLEEVDIDGNEKMGYEEKKGQEKEEDHGKNVFEEKMEVYKEKESAGQNENKAEGTAENGEVRTGCSSILEDKTAAEEWESSCNTFPQHDGPP